MKHLFRTIAAVLTASVVLFSCSKESPVKALTDFANTLEQTYQNFEAQDWTNALSTFATLQDALKGYKCNEAEQASVKDAQSKILGILEGAKDSLDEEAQSQIASAVESSKSLLDLMGISDDSLFVELEDQDIDLDLEAIANEFAAEAETAVSELAKDNSIPFQAVEEKPLFDGGDANKFSKWVANNIVYPETAKENETEGRVILQFVVNEAGAVEDVRVIKGVEESIDAEAIRVVSSSPVWTPGKQNGTPVSVKYTFPVVFAIR